MQVIGYLWSEQGSKNFNTSIGIDSIIVAPAR
jgi:hypothetical protein